MAGDPLLDIIGSLRCTDCARCDWPSFATGDQAVIHLTANCFHPDVLALDSFVVGPGYPKPCREARADGAPCGPDAKLYQPKGKRP